MIFSGEQCQAFWHATIITVVKLNVTLQSANKINRLHRNRYNHCNISQHYTLQYGDGGDRAADRNVVTILRSIRNKNSWIFRMGQFKRADECPDEKFRN